jgi:hypothetical protein
MIALILDSKTVIVVSAETIDLCLKAVIPSLLPFMLLSSILCKTLAGKSFRVLKPLGRFIGIPKGAESLWIIGLLGGYPIGAKCINDAYKENLITQSSARQMLAFSSNAGPSFIFGIIGPLLSQISTVWILWVIHIISSIITAAVVSNKCNESCTLKHTEWKFAEIIPNCLRSMASICTCILIFRIILSFLDRWLFHQITLPLQIAISGMMELTNGALMLPNLNTRGDQFIISAGIIGFGGFCILMQTISVTERTGLGMYFPGKIIQSATSLLIAYPVQKLIFPKNQHSTLSSMPLIAVSISIIIITYIKLKKSCSIREYNSV